MTPDLDTTIARQGDTVDAICYQHYGYTEGVTEAVLEANPGLADHGPLLPMGTPVVLPVHTQRTARSTVKLWD